MASLKEAAVLLSGRVKELKETLSPELQSVRQSSIAIRKAAQIIEGSWSGSWMGYHSELYYRDFRPRH